MAVPPKMRTVAVSATICRGRAPADCTRARHSPLVASKPSSTRTRASSKIWSSARLSPRDSALYRVCSRPRMAAAVPLRSPLSCARTRMNTAQTNISRQPVVFIGLAPVPNITSNAPHGPDLVGGESYHGCERHPCPIFVKPCVDETLPPRKWLPMFHTFCTEGAADDCRIAMQMHYHRFGQNL